MTAFYQSLWTRLQQTAYRDATYGVAVDAANNVLVSGYTHGDLNGEINSGQSDGFIAKYAGDGSLLWTRIIGGSGGDGSPAVGADKYSNIYVLTGFSSQYSPDPVPVGGVSGSLYKISKFSPTGELLAEVSVVDNLSPRSISITPDGDVLATGSLGMWSNVYISFFSHEYIDSNGTLNSGYWSNTSISAGGVANNSSGSTFFNNNFYIGGCAGDDAFVAKFDMAGNQQWLKLISATNLRGEINAVAHDDNGSIYVSGLSGDILGAGYTDGKVVDNAPGPTTDEERANGRYSTDAFIAKYDESGNLLWIKEFGTNADDAAQSITIDSFGNIYVGGYTDRTYGNTAIIETDAKPFLKVFDSNGNLLWEKIFSETNGDVLALTSDQSGHVYATGASDFSINGETASENSGKNGFVMKLSYITGADSNDTLNGTSGADVIYGVDGNDAIQGGLGNDELIGGNGNDTVNAGDGNDLIIGGDGAGDDVYNGGTGIDTVKYTSALAGIKVNLSTTTGTATSIAANDASHIGNDKLTNIENIIAGNFDDTLTGSAAANVIEGGKGKDNIDGGAGSDTADYSDKTSAVSVTLNGTTAVTVKVNNIAEDTIKNIESIIGGSSSDTLTGDSLGNTFMGGAGSDTLNGGTGIDTADYSDKTSAVSVTLNGATNATVSVGGTTEDTIKNIENIIGGSGNDTLSGDSLANVLNGGGGNDTLKGAAGIDTLNGGAGSDTADFSDKTTAVVAALNGATQVTVTVGGVADDKLINIENLLGGSGNDSLTGDVLANSLSGGNGNDVLNGAAGADTLNGGSGNDVLTGGAGNDAIDGGDSVDTASFADKTISVVIALSAGAGTATIGTETDTLTGIENLTGGSGNDTLTGDVNNNVLAGGAGNDILKGSTGIDTLDGGAGIDTADFSDKTTAVVATLNGATQITVTVGGTAEDKLANIENLFGGSGNDSLIGDSLANTFMGGAGNDTLSGGAGIDTADYSDKTSAVSVTLNGAINAVVNVNSVAEDTIKNIENIIGGSGSDTLTGDALVNVLNGGNGDDVLKGAAGIDTLDGGAGSDTADFSDKTTAVVAALNGATQITVTVGGAAEDKLANIENLFGGSSNDTLTGDALANILNGNAGNDVLKGAAGEDALNGGTGKDTLTGGTGNDQFIFTTALNASTNVDTITDFLSGSDKLVLDDAIFAQLSAGVTADNIVVGTTAALASHTFDANDYLKFDTTTKTLFYDATGNGGSDAIAFVQLTGVSNLAHTDFFII